MKTAIEWLKAAIARHERHMAGTEATDEASQQKMMDEMKMALSMLEQKMAHARGGGRNLGEPVIMAKTSGEGGLVWNKLFPAGTFFRADFPGGKVEINADFCGQVIANWKAMGSPGLPVDYFHRGESENDGLGVEDKKAAGWIEALECRGGELWGGFKWTAQAKALIDADELRYLSPSWWPNGTDRSTGKPQGPTLAGAALLNDPFFKELPRVAAADDPPAPEAVNKEGTMDKAKMIALLGLAATATDAEIEHALKARNEALDDKVKAKAAADKAAVEKAELEAKLKASQESGAELGKRVEQIEKDAKEKASAALVEELVRDEKILPDQAEAVKNYAAAMGVEKAGEFYRKFPKRGVVPVGEKGATTAATGGASDHAKLKAMHAEKVKAGADKLTAWRQLAKEQPELYAKANENIATGPQEMRTKR